VADLIQPLRLNQKKLQAEFANALVSVHRKAGIIGSDQEMSAEAQRLLRLVRDARGPLTKGLEFTELSKISSAVWNEFQDRLGIDLRTLYENIVALEAANKQLDQVVNSDLLTTKSAILKAINQMRVYQFLKEYPDYQDLKVVDFIRSVNETSRRPFAFVDPHVRVLELPARFVDRVSMSRQDYRRTKVETRHYGGGIPGGFGSEFSGDNVLDSNPKTFWAELVTLGSPTRVDYKASWGLYRANGVVGEIILTLSNSTRANNLKLLPFSEFPYHIIDVSYKESTAAKDWISIPNFTLRKSVDDWVEFDFPYIAVAQLRISIEQPNYVRGIYVLPKEVIHRNAVWSQIHASVFRQEVHETELSTAELGLVEAEPEQLAYLSALSLADEAAGRVDLGGERQTTYRDYSRILDSFQKSVDGVAPGVSNEVREPIEGGKSSVEREVVQLTRYEYMYGIKIVELSNVLYETHAYYESAPFATGGTVTEVQLETDEVHPSFTDGLGTYRKTSVEWEIEVAPDVRFPIVPVTDIVGSNYIVRDEWVKLRGETGSLRFTPASGSAVIRKNGRRVPMTSTNVSGKNVTVAGATPNAIYTATYYVNSSDVTLDIDSRLNSTRLLTPEEFDGTDKDNAIHLKFYPYIVYEIVRDRSLWTRLNERQAKWTWTPEFFPISGGTIQLTNDSAAVVGTNTLFTSLDDASAYSLKLYRESTGEVLDIASITDDTNLTLSENYTGPSGSGLLYIAGRTVTHDGITWGLNLQNYEPIQVFVDDIRANNLTDYYAREHPAFGSSTDSDQYDFIHSGRSLYFNKPISGRKIRVNYSWLMQYLKLVATLRDHVPVQTFLTPKVDSARIRIKSTEL